MKKIKKIAIFSTAMVISLIVLIVRVVLGIVAFIIFSIPSVKEAVLASGTTTMTNLGVLPNFMQLSPAMQGLLLIILGPVISAIITFVIAAVLIWLYNLVAKRYAITIDLV